VVLGVAASTLHRWLTAGIIVGEQPTPGASWRIRVTDELRTRFVEEAPPGYLPMLVITNSNFVGCSTGRSAGLAPLKMLSTYTAARRSNSVKLAL
jgi:hypothetical protein